jgi:hypothetical protein
MLRAGQRAPVQGKMLAVRGGGAQVEGVHVGPIERERRLAKHLVDRSHRGVAVRQRRPPSGTLGEEAALVLSLAFIFAAVALTLAFVMLLP